MFKPRTGLVLLVSIAVPLCAADQEPFQLIGAEDGGAIKLSRSTAVFQYALQFKATAAAKGLTVDVTPFTGPDGSQEKAAWTLDGHPRTTPIDLAAGDSAILEIKATLPATGDYYAFIKAAQKDKPAWIKSLLVTRTRTAAPLEVNGLDAARGSGSTINFWFALTNNSGRDLTLYRPEVKSLAELQTDKKAAQVESGAIAVTTADGHAVPETWQLPAGKPVRLNVLVTGLSPGEFAGSLRVAAPDLTPADQSFSLYMKRSGWWAALLIFGGVVLSFGMKYYSRTLRPRLKWERRVQSLLSELNNVSSAGGGVDAATQRVIQFLERTLNNLFQDLEADDAPDPDKLLNEVAQKLDILPQWINDRALVAAVRPQGDLTKKFVERLAVVEGVLMTPNSSDQERAGASASVESLPADVETAVRQFLETQLSTFDQECGKAPVVVRARLQTTVKPKLAEAQTLLAHNKFDEARARFNDARKAYAGILGSVVKEFVEGAVPVGVDSNDWAQLRKRVKDELAAAEGETDPERAIAGFEHAYAAYLKGVAAGLDRKLKSKKAGLEASNLNDARKEQLKQGFDSIAARVQTVIKAADSDAVAEAAEAYDQAVAEYYALTKELNNDGMAMSTAGENPADALQGAPVPLRAATITEAATIPYSHRERPTIKQLTYRLRWFEVAFQIVVLLIAVVVGLELLWVDNPVWGNWKDLIIAALWGLGLHQVAGATLDPLAIAEKLSK
jgi:hypothetical protein